MCSKCAQKIQFVSKNAKNPVKSRVSQWEHFCKINFLPFLATSTFLKFCLAFSKYKRENSL